MKCFVFPCSPPPHCTVFLADHAQASRQELFLSPQQDPHSCTNLDLDHKWSSVKTTSKSLANSSALLDKYLSKWCGDKYLNLPYCNCTFIMGWSIIVQKSQGRITILRGRGCSAVTSCRSPKAFQCTFKCNQSENTNSTDPFNTSQTKY